MKISNEKIIVAVSTLLSFLFVFACAEVSVDPELNLNGSGGFSDNKIKAQEPFFHTIDITTQKTCKIEGINGTIDLESVSGTNRVTISGNKIVSANTYQDALSQLDYLKVEISKLTNELIVKTSQPQLSNGRTFSVNYTIKVPDNLDLVIKSINGNIKGKVTVPSQGIVDVRLTNGVLELNIPQTTSAEFSASTINGSISTHNLNLHNRIETFKSLQGTLEDGEGTISLKSTNASIEVSGY